jgi:ATP-dependent DNA helicase RecQ
LRRTIAGERQVSSFVIFNDATLRDLARIRPSAPERMRAVYGVGDAKLREFGPRFLDLIRAYAAEHGLSLDQVAGPPPAPTPRERSRPVAAGLAFALFREGAAIPDVMHQLDRARGTVMDYLADYIHTEQPASIATWVPEDLYHRVAAAAREVGTDRLKPIFLALGEQVDYDTIRLVVAHLANKAATA